VAVAKDKLQESTKASQPANQSTCGWPLTYVMRNGESYRWRQYMKHRIAAKKIFMAAAK